MPRRSRGPRGPSPAEVVAPTPWERLLPEMQRCARCDLASTRRQVVVYRGPPRPFFLFVGEAPGAQEDLQGLPFVGRAGRLLDAAAASSGLRPEEWGVTNVLMCRPPENRFLREAASSCRPWLSSKVASLAPQVLITLGANALEAFLPEALPVSSATGRTLRWGGRPLFPMLHPAATLHSRAFADRWRQDWASFAQALPGWRGSAAFTAAKTP